MDLFWFHRVDNGIVRRERRQTRTTGREGEIEKKFQKKPIRRHNRINLLQFPSTYQSLPAATATTTDWILTY